MKTSVGIAAVSTTGCGFLAVQQSLYQEPGLLFPTATEDERRLVVAWIETYFGTLFPQRETERRGREVKMSATAFPRGPSWQMACVAALGEYWLTTPEQEPEDVSALLAKLETYRILGDTFVPWSPSVILVPIGSISERSRDFRNELHVSKLTQLKECLPGWSGCRVILVLPDDSRKGDVENFSWGQHPAPEVWVAKDAPELLSCVARAWRLALGMPESGPGFSNRIASRSEERLAVLRSLRPSAPEVVFPPPRPAPVPPVREIHGIVYGILPPDAGGPETGRDDTAGTGADRASLDGQRGDLDGGDHGVGGDHGRRLPAVRVVVPFLIAAAATVAVAALGEDEPPAPSSSPSPQVEVPDPSMPTRSAADGRAQPRGGRLSSPDPASTDEAAIRLEALRLSKL